MNYQMKQKRRSCQHRQILNLHLEDIKTREENCLFNIVLNVIAFFAVGYIVNLTC
jgi:hypothetical protein